MDKEIDAEILKEAYKFNAKPERDGRWLVTGREYSLSGVVAGHFQTIGEYRKKQWQIKHGSVWCLAGDGTLFEILECGELEYHFTVVCQACDSLWMQDELIAEELCPQCKGIIYG